MRYSGASRFSLNFKSAPAFTFFFLFLPQEVKILLVWSCGTIEQEVRFALDVLLVHLSSDLWRQATFHTHIGAVGKFRQADKATSQVSWEGTPRGNPRSNRMSILHNRLSADSLRGKSKESLFSVGPTMSCRGKISKIDTLSSF